MSNNMEPVEKVGILSLLDLGKKEMTDLLDYISATSNTDVFDMIYGCFGDQTLKFIDLFSGESVKVPTRLSVFKAVRYIRIYRFCEARGFTDESIDIAAKVFDRRKNSIRRIIEKVQKVEEKKNNVKEDS